MGRSAREENKTEPIKVRMAHGLLERIERAWKSGYLSHVARQDFLGVLLELGVERYERGDHFAERETDAESEDSGKRSDAAGGM